MNEDSAPKSRRDILKMLDLEHLSNDELRLLSKRELDKNTMTWAVRHISECRKCCSLAPELSAQEITDALTGTAYGRADILQQTIDYYFRTRQGKD
jgi:hypothetical protein